MPHDQAVAIVRDCMKSGIRHFYFDRLHLEKKRHYPADLLDIVGKDFAWLDSIDNDWDFENRILDIFETEGLADCNVFYGWSLKSNSFMFDVMRELGGVPVSSEFNDYAIDNIGVQPDEGLTWDMFYEIMRIGNETLYEKEFPVSWLERYLYIQQRQIYMEHPPIKTYKDLLRIVWNDPRMVACPQNSRRYKILGRDDCGDAVLGLRQFVRDSRERILYDKKTGIPVENF